MKADSEQSASTQSGNPSKGHAANRGGENLSSELPACGPTEERSVVGDTDMAGPQQHASMQYAAGRSASATFTAATAAASFNSASHGLESSAAQDDASVRGLPTAMLADPDYEVPRGKFLW